VKINKIARVVRALLLLSVIPATVGATPAQSVGSHSPRIDAYALGQMAAAGTANIFVKMSTDADLSSAENISDRTERLEFVYSVLTSQSTASQRAITRFLDRRGVRYQSFWINNSIYIYDADAALANALAQRSDVAYVRGDHEVPLEEPVFSEESASRLNAVEWNVQMINADDVWAQGITGEGVVVANIDTGVRYTHEALVNQYRGNNGDGTFSHDYNWWDPNMALAAPADNVDHGTHTMGTMVGGDGPGPFTEDIGIAPGAKWIAAKGCANISCSDFRLISSAQWIACPTRVDGTNPDCSKAPDIVNNSWGGGGGDPWYNSYVRSWLMAGILPVFSIGNSGPACSTAGSPGDYSLAIGVGATDINDVLADFSSKGPGDFRKLKPDFSAPGVAVRSSVRGSDSAYAVFSGTSMAAPHVSGTAALILSADPGVGLLGIYNALRNTTVTSLGSPPGPTSCAGRSYDVFPNAIYGWGRIDAAAAVGFVAP
jgi:subtilisin family serine protease